MYSRLLVSITLLPFPPPLLPLPLPLPPAPLPAFLPPFCCYLRLAAFKGPMERGLVRVWDLVGV